MVLKNIFGTYIYSRTHYVSIRIFSRQLSVGLVPIPSKIYTRLLVRWRR